MDYLFILKQFPVSFRYPTLCCNTNDVVERALILIQYSFRVCLASHFLIYMFLILSQLFYLNFFNFLSLYYSHHSVFYNTSLKAVSSLLQYFQNPVSNLLTLNLSLKIHNIQFLFVPLLLASPCIGEKVTTYLTAVGIYFLRSPAKIYSSDINSCLIIC